MGSLRAWEKVGKEMEAGLGSVFLRERTKSVKDCALKVKAAPWIRSAFQSRHMATSDTHGLSLTLRRLASTGSVNLSSSARE
jgi:hypothetical protein